MIADRTKMSNMVAPDAAHLKRAQELTTLMVVDHVKPKCISDYEGWLTGIHGDLQVQRGFVSVDVIRHLDQPNPEYVILVKFDNQESLNCWRSSSKLADWLSKLEGLIERKPHFEEAIGLELWFDRASSSQHELPAFWKRVVLSIACVYSMIVFLSWAFGPIIGSWPPAGQIFLIAIVLSALLTWPIMPYATRLLKPWLYRK